jgi:hypothetical protein
MGAYCRFCGQRCFVVRVIPDGASRGKTYALATCQAGMAHDLGRTGHTHITALNPVLEPEAVAALATDQNQSK